MVGGDSNEKNWKGIIISILVIAVILGLITVAIFIRNKGILRFDALSWYSLYFDCCLDAGSQNEKNAFTFDDVIGKGFEIKRFNGTWINSKNQSR